MKKLGKVLNLDLDPLEKPYLRSKILLTGIKPLSFVSCHMEGNVEVIHFYIKKSDAQALVFAQIAFQKCTISFDCFGIKMRIANL